MRTWLLVLGLLASCNAVAQYSRCSEFRVGDTVEMYRHWDHENKRWNNWPEEQYFGTKWRIVELLLEVTSKGKPHPMIRVQLIEGRMRTSEKEYHPGFVTLFFSSESYMRANPSSFLQFCDEFRKVP
jgi:hypothetical protein